MNTSEFLFPAALFLAAASLGAAPPSSGFRFTQAGADSLELTEDGKTVYVYNHGMMLKRGVPEQFRRSSYLHPVYTPGGVLLTDDFPKDHYHHRGIFWAWRVVSFDGETHDLWTIEGIRHRFIRWIARKVVAGSARLVVENGWFAGERQVMKETVEIVTRPSKADRRRMEFTLTFEALGHPVELSGSPDRGYSGFGMRFAPREQTVLHTEGGVEKEDTNLVPHPWAQLSASFAGRKAGARIDIDLSNPAYPNGWCLRHYGYLGVDFPGMARFKLEPGRPVTLRYHVTLFDGLQ